MPKFSFPKSSKNSKLSSHFLHLFFSICSVLLSFSYFIFIFLSPYLFRLLSFLSPLISITALLLAPLLTLTSPTSPIHENYGSESLKSRWEHFILSVFHSCMQWLRSKTHHQEQEFGSFHEFEGYILTLQHAICEVELDYSSEGSEGFDQIEEQRVNSKEIIAENVDATNDSSERRLDFDSEKEACANPEEMVAERGDDLEAIGRIEGNKMSQQGLFQQTKESEDREDRVMHQDQEPNKIGKNGSPNEKALVSNLEVFDSIRIEKRWERTLACKLLEERCSICVIEGMDMLWETSETDTTTDIQEKVEEEVGTEREMCCFQPLDLSVGKMNLGMKKSKFLKISKALKGIGWLNHVRRRGRVGTQ